jgi:3',5'-cyclic AMP phosphodiesterase CpdA
MKPVKLIFVSTLLILILVSAHAQENKSWFFIQLTDTQFGMFDANKGFAKETELYEKAVNGINKLKPDFVVITGDLVNDEYDRSQVAEFKRITAKINKDIPVYYVPGNHDIGQSPTQKEIDQFISDYGYDRFSFTHKNGLFIGLNSCLIKSNTPDLEYIQLTWLKNELEKGRNSKHIILFTHYPFFIKTFDEPETYSNIAIETRTKYLEIFKENDVDAVFAGHLHKNASAKYGEIEMITTNAAGKPLGSDSSGFRIVKVYGNKIETEFCSLDEIPESVWSMEAGILK